MRFDSEGLVTRRRALLAAVAVSLALAGCGKKGPLEPAAGSPDAKKTAEPQQSTDGGVPAFKGVAKRPPAIKKPKEDFILDRLLF